MIIFEKDSVKHCRSKDYNYRFDLVSGEFIRWGKTFEDDPVSGPLEIFDLEVSTVCSGIPSIGSTVPSPCAFCYKSNTKRGENMSFDTFKAIFDKLPATLTQIAFGIGDINSNNDLINMFNYCREHGVIPNLTINGYGLTDKWVEVLSSTLGGIAVSRYSNKDVCYDAIKKLTDAGMKQVNIHYVLSEETIDEAYNLLYDVKNDSRLAKLKAVVFLTLKPKGNRNKNHTVTDTKKYKDLIEHAFSNNIGIGFDSCGAKMFLQSVKDHPQFEKFVQLAESCESLRFSGYANVLGHFYPCSFTEDEDGWKEGLNILTCNDFTTDIWNHPKSLDFRERLINTTDKSICHDCMSCVTFPELY